MDMDVANADGGSSAKVLLQKLKLRNIELEREILSLRQREMHSDDDCWDEARFRSLFDHAWNGMVLADVKERTLINANRSFLRMTGYTLDELPALRVENIYSPESLSTVAEIFGSLAHGGSSLAENIPVLRRDGGIFYADINLRSLSMNGTQYVLGEIRDLTEQRMARQAIRDVEDNHRRIYNSMRDALAVVDMSGRIIDCNQAYRDMLGFSLAELKHKTYVELTPEKWHSFEAQIVETQVLLLDESELYEKEYIGKDGKVFPVELKTVLLRDKDGQPEAMWAIVRDITERKRAAAQIDQLMHEQNAILDSRIVGTVKVRDRLFSWSNAAFAEMFGYSCEELIGQSARVIYPNDDAYLALAKCAYPVLSKGDVYRSEIQLVRKDGSGGWYEISGALLHMKSDESIWVFADITTKKQFELDLADREAHLHTVFSSMTDGLVLYSSDGKVIDANPAAEKILGLSRAEILDRTSVDPRWQVIHEDGTLFPSEKHPVMVVLQTGKSIRTQTMGIVDPSGDLRWINVNASPVMGSDMDSPQSVVATFVDITAQKKNKVALEQARALAESANYAKSRFLAAASHDLRQPLSALTLYLGVLERRVSRDVIELVSNIKECTVSLSELLTDLLDVSKLDAGVIIPKISEFSIDDMLATLVSVHSAGAELKGVDLRFRSSCSFVRTDQTLLRRLVSNLIANAIEYTSRGGVLVACRYRQGNLWMEVWDTGAGIPQNQVGSIFDEFKQFGDESRSRGSGLGLSIVDKTATLLGLKLHVRSRLGRGSMFAVELPKGQAPDVHPVTPSRPPNRYLRIGLVDDNVNLCKSLVLALQAAGHDAVGAGGGAELLARLGQDAPDIVISDYRLAAGENGFDVIESCRAVFGQDLPAFLITGDTDPALIRSMADRGIAVHYKPFPMDALQIFLDEALEPTEAMKGL